MELSIFMKELESALIKRGIPEETAHKHVSSIRRTFTSEDLAEVNSIKAADEINDLADSIAALLKKRAAQAPASQHAQPKPTQPKTVQTKAVPKPTQTHTVPQKPKVAEVKVHEPPKVEERNTDAFDMNDEFFTYSSDRSPSTKGMTIFWVGLFATLPITLPLLALLFGAFAAVFAALVGVILLGVVALIGIVGVGAVLSLVGIIFGVTQLFSFVPAGIYEIGLGVIIAGVVLFVSVLIYNLIVRFVPWLMKKVAKLLSFVCGKLKILFNLIRRECYKL